MNPITFESQLNQTIPDSLSEESGEAQTDPLFFRSGRCRYLLVLRAIATNIS